MNKDEIVEDVLKAVEKQPNPWIPYEGPAGGQGWMNTITGDVRYQDDRPAPGEGTPEDAGPQSVAGLDQEIPDTLTEIPDPSDLPEYAEEGMEITFEHPQTGEEMEGEITETYGDLSLDVETDEGDVNIGWEDIEDHPVELEPEMGWGDGWQAAPEDFSEITREQTVEIYDLEEGEYKEGVVDWFEEDFNEEGETYVEISTEDGQYEFVGGENPDGEALVTAQEQLIPDHAGEKLSYDDLADLEKGDEVLVRNTKGTTGAKPVTGTVVESYTNGDVIIEWEREAGVSADDDETVTWESEDLGHMIEDGGIEVWEKGPEYAEPSEVLPEGFDDEDWELLEDEQVVMDHPAFGEVEGELEIEEDPEGYDWLSVTREKEPEVGDTFELETTGDEYEVLNIYEEMGDTYVELEESGGYQTEWLMEDVLAQFDEEQEVSLTTNPDHPLYFEDYLEQVEDPWAEEYDVDDLKVGDWVVTGDEAEQITQKVPDGYLTDKHPDPADAIPPSNAWIDSAAPNEEIDPDDKHLSVDEWRDPVEVDEQGDVDFPTINPDDVVYYYDEEEGEMVTAPAAEQSMSDEVTIQDGFDEDGNPKTVDRSKIEGYAPEGFKPLPESVVDDYEVHAGSEVEAVYNDEVTGEREVAHGIVVEAGIWGLHIVDSETGELRQLPSVGSEDVAITEHDLDPRYSAEDWDSASAEDLVDEIEEGGGIDHGRTELTSAGKKKLKAELHKRFPSETVSQFYDLQSDEKGAWKGSSGTEKAGRYEAAFREGLDIDADVRHDMKSPGKDMEKLAAVVSEISQRHFEEQFGEQHELHRGASIPGSASLFAQYLLMPEAEEYENPMLAINNFSDEKSIYHNFEKGITVRHETKSDEVAALHDHLFSASHGHEREVTVRGDYGPVSSEDVYIDSTELSLDQPVEEMGEDTLDHISTELNKSVGGETWEVLEEKGLNDEQIEEMLKIDDYLNEKTDHRRSHGSFFRELRQEAEERGIDPDDVHHPEVSEPSDYWPEGIESEDDWKEGMEVEYENFYDEVQQGTVEDIRTDGPATELLIDEPEGGQAWTHVENVGEILDSPEPFGPHAEQIGEPIPDSVTPGDEVVVQPFGSNNKVETGVLMEKPDDYSGNWRVSIDGQSEPYEPDRLGPLPEDEPDGDEEDGVPIEEQTSGEEGTASMEDLSPDGDEGDTPSVGELASEGTPAGSILGEGDKLDVLGFDEPFTVEQVEDDGTVHLDNGNSYSPEDNNYGVMVEDAEVAEVGGVNEPDSILDTLENGDIIETTYESEAHSEPVEVVSTHPQNGTVRIQNAEWVTTEIPEHAVEGIVEDAEEETQGIPESQWDEAVEAFDPGDEAVYWDEYNDEVKDVEIVSIADDGQGARIEVQEGEEEGADFNVYWDKILTDPSEVANPEFDTSEWGRLPPHEVAEELQGGDLSLADSFVTDVPAGPGSDTEERAVQVTDVPDDDAQPVVVEDEEGRQYQIWPSGEVFDIT